MRRKIASRRLRHRADAAVALILASVALGLIGASPASANGVALEKGDVLAGVGNAKVKNFTGEGVLQDTLTDSTAASFTTGMCFDSKNNLYVTDFETSISVYNSGGNLVSLPFGEGYAGGHPESCTLDSANNIFVGGPFSASIEELSSEGKLLATFPVESAGRTGGTDWVDLAADQCTIYYTGEGSVIKRFNVCTNTQEADFATGLPGPCFALRIRPSGEVLVACESEVVRLGPGGEVLKTYALAGSQQLFALNLDPDGTSFWTGDIINGQIWRVDIESGIVIKEFNSEPSTQLAGLAVVGEVEVVPDIDLEPQTATNEVGSMHTVTATVEENGKHVGEGVEVSFTVTGANPTSGMATTNASGEASFTYKGESVGEDDIVASFKDKAGHTVESETVTKIWKEPEHVCSKIHGVGHWGPRSPEGGNLGDNLSTTLTEKEELQTTGPGGEFHVRVGKLTSASCVAISGGFEFSGTGPAKFDHEGGYTASFAFAKTGGQTFYTLIVEKEGSVVVALLSQQLDHGGKTEHIS